MVQRIRRFFNLEILVMLFVVGVFTWILSWFMQWVIGLAFTEEAFRPIRTDAIELTLASLCVVLGICVATLWIHAMNSFMSIAFAGVCGLVVMAAVIWVSVTTFPGTTVSTPFTQILYSLGLLAWGCMTSRILLEGVEPVEEQGSSTSAD